MRYKLFLALFLSQSILFAQSYSLIPTIYYAAPNQSIGFGIASLFSLALEVSIPDKGDKFYPNISPELAQSWRDDKIGEYDSRAGLFFGPTIPVKSSKNKKEVLFVNFYLGIVRVSHRVIYQDDSRVLGNDGKYSVETGKKRR